MKKHRNTCLFTKKNPVLQKQCVGIISVLKNINVNSCYKFCILRCVSCSRSGLSALPFTTKIRTCFSSLSPQYALAKLSHSSNYVQSQRVHLSCSRPFSIDLHQNCLTGYEIYYVIVVFNDCIFFGISGSSKSSTLNLDIATKLNVRVFLSFSIKNLE